MFWITIWIQPWLDCFAVLRHGGGVSCQSMWNNYMKPLDFYKSTIRHYITFLVHYLRTFNFLVLSDTQAQFGSLSCFDPKTIIQFKYPILSLINFTCFFIHLESIDGIQRRKTLMKSCLTWLVVAVSSGSLDWWKNECQLCHYWVIGLYNIIYCDLHFVSLFITSGESFDPDPTPGDVVAFLISLHTQSVVHF